MKPGDSLSENEISLKLKVSRTPVREAFLRLSQEGLLEIYPQKGTFVTLIDLDLVEEARFMREHLERAVVSLACERFSKEHSFDLDANLRMQELCMQEQNYSKFFELDEQFHQTIFIGCNKKRSWQLLRNMKIDFDRIRILRVSTDFNWNQILKQHQEIVQAIKEQNAGRAEELMREHLSLVVGDKEDLKIKYPNYFK